MTSLKRIKLLVVDDNAHTLACVTNLLHDVGVGRIVTAQGGTEAVSLLAKERFDAILTDWYMPDVNGESLIKIVHDKRFETNRGVPVVVMTAYATSENMKRAKALNVKDVLFKPLTEEMLGETLTRLAEAIPARFDDGDGDEDFFAI